jgi:hypothetical protein
MATYTVTVQATLTFDSFAVEADNEEEAIAEAIDWFSEQYSVYNNIMDNYRPFHKVVAYDPELETE